MSTASRIPTFAWPAAPTPKAGDLFPLDLSDDPWIAFHGTSQANANAIERDGLSTTALDTTLMDAASQMVSAYERLHWSGTDSGGFAVLKSWSTGTDVLGAGRRWIYLAESAMRASVYASSEFAGGECRRAFRKAFDDLKCFSESAEAQKVHRAFLETEPSSAHVIWDQATVDLLPSLLEELGPVARGCRDFCDNAGIIYALRFTPDDLPHLELRGAMGLRSSTPIPADRIVGRMFVPSGYRCAQGQDNRRLAVWTEPRGLWLRAAGD